MARLTGVDAARGVALLGMMAVHVLPAEAPSGATSTAYLLASGRAAALFAVLAGVGLALAYGGGARRTAARREGRPSTSRAGVAAALAARALAVGLIGLLLGFFDSGVAVILANYGLLFLVAIPLLRLPVRALAALAGAGAFVVPAVSHLLRRALPEPSGANPDLLAAVAEPGPLLIEVAITGYYPVIVWAVYLCAGLAVGRLALRSARVAAGLVVGGTVLAVGASLASYLLLERLGGREALAAGTPGLEPGELDELLTESEYGTTPATTWWWLAVDAPHSGTPADLAHTIGTALALLGAALLLARLVGWALAPLAAAGSMTLTIYTVHVLLLASGLLPADDETSYVAQVLVFVSLAWLWRRRGRRGPLEAAVGALAGAAARVVTPGLAATRT